MRVNVYEEELNGKSEKVTKMANNLKNYHGLRVHLDSHENLPEGHESSVTFWFESSEDMKDFFRELYEANFA